MTAFSAVKPAALKFKASPKIPARLLEGPGIDITKSHGDTTISVDFSGLKRDDSPDITSLYSVAWNPESEVPELIPSITFKGDKGDQGDVGNASVDLGWGDGSQPIQDIFDDPKRVRIAANVRQDVNYFDFLHASGRSSTVREQIANGTFTGDQGAEWGAFHAALAAIDAAGGYPRCVIPQCAIYTSQGPNFAINNLIIQTEGMPEIVSLNANPGFYINGNGLGVGGYGVRHMQIGTLMARAPSGFTGIHIREMHQSSVKHLRSQGASGYGIYINACVTTRFQELNCEPQSELLTPIPNIGVYIGGQATGLNTYTSWCQFDSIIAEYCPINIEMEYAYGCLLSSGTGEAGQYGLVMRAQAEFNKIHGVDFEQNSVMDLYCEGLKNDFFGVDTQKTQFTGVAAKGNSWFGGSAIDFTLDGGAGNNVVKGLKYYTSLLDPSNANILERNYNVPLNVVHSGPSGMIGNQTITIASQPLEDSMRTWTNPFNTPVRVFIDSNATSVFYKTGSSRFDLGAGGKAISVEPDDKVQVGYTTPPFIQYRIVT